MIVCSTSNVFVVCWVDNKVVTAASHYLKHEPHRNCKCYGKAKKALFDFPQPHLIKKTMYIWEVLISSMDI